MGGRNGIGRRVDRAERRWRTHPTVADPAQFWACPSGAALHTFLVAIEVVVSYVTHLLTLPPNQVVWHYSTASAHSALLLSVAGSGEVVLRRWNGLDRTCSAEWASARGPEAVQSAAWCGQPGRFATGDAAGRVRLWDLARSRSGPVASVALRAPVRALRWIGPTECAPRPLLAAGDDRGEVAFLAVSWQ